MEILKQPIINYNFQDQVYIARYMKCQCFALFWKTNYGEREGVYAKMHWTLMWFSLWTFIFFSRKLLKSYPTYMPLEWRICKLHFIFSFGPAWFSDFNWQILFSFNLFCNMPNFSKSGWWIKCHFLNPFQGTIFYASLVYH